MRHVDVVIALDVSSSMDGLIDSAREKLWDVVNILGKAQPRPVLRVGLISYGHSSYDAGAGWVRKDSDLTTDLDSIYARLFALRTGGGDEYVARAVHDATRTMAWDQDPKSLKILFVAGNEPAGQDPKIPVDSAVRQAREKGIFVNTIYCGSESSREAALWHQVATLGGGRYASIDQNSAVAVATPMDAELGRLSAELNRTYVAYGIVGAEKAQNQREQDKNASGKSGSAAAGRASAKSSHLYRADDWDLVDARAHGGKDVMAMKAEDLPAPMRAMDPAARKVFLDGKAKERAEIQRQIATASAKRDEFLKTDRARRATKGTKALDEALGDAIKTEAQSAGFAF